MPHEREPSTVPTFGAPPADPTTGADGTQHQSVAPLAALSEPGLPSVPGYAVAREIARGGMGVVYAAHDPTFERDVAVKVMHHGQDAGRFVVESKVTARLPHPGVPPVYELGEIADGRPFLAMKLIEGRTLADELKGATRADLPRLLDAVQRIGQTVGFAHARGIVHRDLKPSNVMVGAFGEVLVMDWGLAKRVPSAGAETRSGADEPTANLPPGAAPAVEETAAGQVKGTPAYMAPEQARGEQVDARADVFALGGVLAAVLTGKAPFGGTTVLDTVMKAAAADLAECFARLDASGTDLELVAVAKTCLAPAARDRYPDGSAVAAALADYRAGVEERLRRSERERAAAEARAAEEQNTRREAEARAAAERAGAAEQHKRRRVQLLLAGALVLLAAGAGGFAWYFEHEAAERRVAAERAGADQRAVEARLDAERELAARQARQGVTADLALAADLRKQGKFKPAAVAIEQAAALAKGAPELLPTVDRARRDLAFVAQLDDIRYRKWAIAASTGAFGAFNTAGAAPEYRAAFAARDLDLTALDPAAAAARIAEWDIKPELVAAIDDWAIYEPDAALRERLSEVARLLDRGAWTDRLRAPARWTDRAALERLAAEADVATLAPAAIGALAELMMRLRIDPTKLLVAAREKHPTDFELAFALGRWQCLTFTDGREVGPYEAARALRPDHPAVWNNLGDALRRRGDLKGAAAALSRAIELDGRFAQFRSNLGSVLFDAGDLKGAIATYRDALARDPKLDKTHNNLGVALFRAGDPAGAVDAYQKSLDLDPRAAGTWSNLGNALRARGDLTAALAAHQRAVELDPNLATARFNLGLALLSRGDRAGAREALKKATELDPRNARAHSAYASALHDLGDLAGAVAAYRRALELDPNLVIAHVNLGNALRDKGELEASAAALARAIELAPKSADAHYNLGLTRQLQKNATGAVAAYRAALALNPKDAEALHNLGVALLDTGDADGAVAAHRKVLDLAPRIVQAHYHLGLALKAKGELPAARAALQRFAQLRPKNPQGYVALGEVLLDLRDLDGAEAACRRAIELDPRGATAPANLGTALFLKGDLNGARAAYEKALDLDPRAAKPHYNLATVFAQQKNYAEAIANARMAVRLDPKYANAHALLGAARQLTGDISGARAALTEAARLDKKYAALLAQLPPLEVAPPPREKK